MLHRLRNWPARAIGPAVLSTACLIGAGARAAPADDHRAALAALADVRAAIGEIMHAENGYATDKKLYRGLAQRAINTLVGSRSQYYDASAGSAGDVPGAIGHIDALLDRKETPPWVTALHGAEANIRAAVANLLDAKSGRELMDFQIAASRALGHLDVALGRPNEIDVFGGLEGALATTVLGVPAGGNEVDACAPVPSAPAYGTHAGYLAYVAVPATPGTHALPGPSGGTEVSVAGGVIVLSTTAAPIVAKLCGKRAAEESPIRSVGAAVADPSGDAAPANQPAAPASTASPPPAATQNPPHPRASKTPKPAGTTAQNTGAVPALYTTAQAAAGEKLFAQHCVSCHGANLQGTAAPSVAGNDFLETAKQDGWSVKIIRYIVFNLMPRNSPGTLIPEQSAEVMAYLLASNCYPAGSKPFPTEDDPAFEKIQMGPVPGQHPNENNFGVCALGTGSAGATK